jgi:hypothetical protein
MSKLSILGFSLFGVLGLVALSGCSREDNSEVRVGRHERRSAVKECTARIEVYPASTPRPQPYRVLAPIDAGFVGNWGWSATSRYERMKRRACELGADAIIDAPDERVADNRVTTTLQYDAYGRPVTIVQENPTTVARRGAALAIQFVAPTAPAPVVVEVPAPAPVVVPVEVERGACPVNTETCGAVCCDTGTAVCDPGAIMCVRR